MLSLNPLPSLPRHSGPFNVGSTEYEIPITEIDSHVSPPDSTITTIKFRLFYPTDATSTKESITWIPRPQKQWIQAFSSFLGASLGWSHLIQPILSVMNYITIPAVANAPLRTAQQSKPNPLAIFSHGLAGNCNMYSAVCGSMASCGVIVAAPEHRDGSSPVSWVRGPGGKIESEITYRKYAHNPTADVFNGRNSQLRIRLWELDLMYSALNKMNEGQQLTNYACESSKGPSFKSSMDFTPGHVSWLGHSFGAATITQFVKSIYYHNSLPVPNQPPGTDENDWAPLYRPTSDSKLIQQITPDSPIALLDVWTLPFRAPSAQSLWKKPFPCYDRKSSSNTTTNTVAIMSTEFYNYTDLRKRTQALLSQDPVQAERHLAQQLKVTDTSNNPAPSSPHITTPPHKTTTEAPPASSTTQSLSADTLPTPTLPLSASPSPSPNPSPNTLTPSSSLTSLSTHLPTTNAPRLFTIPQSAHLSQSDFGLLFPTLTRYLMKCVDPVEIINLNVRGILAVMRGVGLDVRRIDRAGRSKGEGNWWRRGAEREEMEAEEEEDVILSGGNDVEGTNGRWIEVEIPVVS